MKSRYSLVFAILGIFPSLAHENNIDTLFTKNGVTFQKFENLQDLPVGLEDQLKSAYINQQKKLHDQEEDVATKEWQEKVSHLGPDFSLIVSSQDQKIFSSFFLETTQLMENVKPIHEEESEVTGKIETTYGEPFVRTLQCLVYTHVILLREFPISQKKFYSLALDCGEQFFPKPHKFFFPVKEAERNMIRENDVWFLFSFEPRFSIFFGGMGEYPKDGEELKYTGPLLDKYPLKQWKLLFYHR